MSSTITPSVGDRLALEADSVLLDGEPLRLSPTEKRILILLMRHAGRCLDAETIGRLLERDLARISPVTVQVHIHNLRRKLERDPNHPLILRNIPSQGYTLSAV